MIKAEEKIFLKEAIKLSGYSASWFRHNWPMLRNKFNIQVFKKGGKPNGELGFAKRPFMAWVNSWEMK